MCKMQGSECRALRFRGSFGNKVGLGISRTNEESQWNPVYKASYRISCCGNENILR